jgi:hypothetical protein
VPSSVRNPVNIERRNYERSRVLRIWEAARRGVNPVRQITQSKEYHRHGLLSEVKLSFLLNLRVTPHDSPQKIIITQIVFLRHFYTSRGFNPVRQITQSNEYHRHGPLSQVKQLFILYLRVTRASDNFNQTKGLFKSFLLEAWRQPSETNQTVKYFWIFKMV